MGCVDDEVRSAVNLDLLGRLLERLDRHRNLTVDLLRDGRVAYGGIVLGGYDRVADDMLHRWRGNRHDRRRRLT